MAGLEDSVEKGTLVEENSYEAFGSHKLPESHGPQKERITASGQFPKLFEGCHFYCHGEFRVFEKDDLVKLIELGGGKQVKREPKIERIDELMRAELPDHLDVDETFHCSFFNVYDPVCTKTIREMSRVVVACRVLAQSMSAVHERTNERTRTYGRMS